MTHTEFLKLLEERPLRMAPQPAPPAVPAKSQAARATLQEKSDDQVGTGAVVLLVALVFWTTYFLMARLTSGI